MCIRDSIIIRRHTDLTHGPGHPLVTTHTHTVSNLRWVLLRVRHTVRHTGQLLAARAVRRGITHNTHRVLHVLAMEEQGAGLCVGGHDNQNTADQKRFHVCVCITTRLYIITTIKSSILISFKHRMNYTKNIKFK